MKRDVSFRTHFFFHVGTIFPISSHNETNRINFFEYKSWKKNFIKRASKHLVRIIEIYVEENKSFIFFFVPPIMRFLWNPDRVLVKYRFDILLERGYLIAG